MCNISNSKELVFLQNIERLQSIIKDGDNMIFKTPFNQYILYINRYDSTCSTDYGNRYIIETNIMNNLGTSITKFRMNESTVLSLLDTMDVFLNCYDYNKMNNNISFYCDACQANMTSIILQMNRTDNYSILEDLDSADLLSPANKKYLEYFDKDNEQIREITITINQYSPVYQTIIPLLNFKLSDAEFNNLMFAYFFTSLIDIDLSYEDESKLNNIIERSFFHYTPIDFKQ